jgi:hypothetical protein
MKATLAANLAFVVRAARFGLHDATARLPASYTAMDPFGSRPLDDVEPDRNDERGDIAAIYGTIEEVDLRQLVGSPSPVVVDSRFVSEDGSLPIHELIPLLAILRSESPRSVLEIGTYFGSTAANMALNLPDAAIATLDLHEEIGPGGLAAGGLEKDDFHLIARRQVGRAYLTLAGVDNVVQHFGDTAEWDFSRAGPGTTFFFVDGSHTYEYAKNDTIECINIIKYKSVIIWHDCDLHHPGVVRWLGEMVADGFPVRRVSGTSLGYLRFGPEDVPRGWIEARRSPRRRREGEAVCSRPHHGRSSA